MCVIGIKKQMKYSIQHMVCGKTYDLLFNSVSSTAARILYCLRCILTYKFPLFKISRA